MPFVGKLVVTFLVYVRFAHVEVLFVDMHEKILLFVPRLWTSKKTVQAGIICN